MSLADHKCYRVTSKDRELLIEFIMYAGHHGIFIGQHAHGEELTILALVPAEGEKPFVEVARTLNKLPGWDKDGLTVERVMPLGTSNELLASP
jgi:hypothetical protein